MSTGSAIPAHIVDWADVILPLHGQWNGTEVVAAGGGGWLLDADGQLCAGNATGTAAAAGQATQSNVYVRRRVFINHTTRSSSAGSQSPTHTPRRRKLTFSNTARIKDNPHPVTHHIYSARTDREQTN